MINPVTNKYRVGDRVFAKVKGCQYWPAVVDKIDSSTKITKYNVTFYGTKKLGVNIKENDICLFYENKSRLSQQYQKSKGFFLALKEADQSISNQNSNFSLDCSSDKSIEFSVNSTFSRENNTSEQLHCEPLAVSSPKLPNMI